jgi:predicted TIM-barrel fold metal-dependent hydrolase
MKKLLIVSADNHCGGRCEDYLPYLEPEYHAALESQMAEEKEFLAVERGFGAASDNALSNVEIIDQRNAMRDGGALGVWDVERRLEALDDEGIAAEVVNVGHHLSLTPFFTMLSRPHPSEVRSAGARAHHRWFAEKMAPGKGRIFGVADPGGCEDIAAAVREVHWCADHGFVAMGCPHATEDKELPPLYDRRYFEPFWRACVDRGLVLSVHFGYNSAQGKFFEFLERIKADPALGAELAKGTIEDFIKAVQNVKVDLRPRQAFWQLIQGGVFDRYPQMKVVFSEVRSDWLPDTLAYLDERFEKAGRLAKLKPSEYFQRHCYVAPSSPRPSEMRQRREIGIDRMLLGVDYPHVEGTWPNTWDWLRSIFTDVSEEEARKFAGLNAIGLFKLDEAYLTGIAERIGPEISDIVGSQKRLDPKLLDHFHFRSGYKSPAEVVDRQLLAEAVQADLAGMRRLTAGASV